MRYQYTRWLCILTIFGLWGCASKKLTNTNRKDEANKKSFPDNTLVGPQNNGTYVIPTSQIIEPAGETVTFLGRAVDAALNTDETILVVKNMTNIEFIDVKTHFILQTLDIPKAGSTFKGICFSSDGKKVWITDSKGFLRSAKLQKNNLFAWDDLISLPSMDEKSSYPGGFALDEKNGLIYVALNRNNSVGVVNTNTGKMERQIPVGIAPYSVTLVDNKAYVTNWGGRRPGSQDMTGPSSGSRVVIDKKNGVASTGTVSVIDLSDNKIITEIPVLLHPCGMAASPDGASLYVANASSDMISVIDTRTNKVIDSISAKPMTELPFGSTPNALAISPDNKILYIANAGDNLITVFDLNENKIKGLIPTGWYPSAINISKNGKELFVVNMKGIGSRGVDKNKKGYSTGIIMKIQKDVLIFKNKKGYNTRRDQTGSVSFIPTPGADSLESYTVKAGINMRLPKINEALHLKNVKEKIVPVPTRPGEKSPIKHIIYIIKENRTYDQVFGDLPQGNGDSSLCMFGRYVTPNQHKLAEEYVLLDNTYCNGVLSAEGHQWTSQGYVTDYLEKAFPDFVRGYPWNGDDAIVYSPSGFIWDKVLQAGLKFRDYGEFVKDELTPANATWTDIYNDYKAGTHKIKIKAIPTIHTIANYICTTYTGSPRQINDQYKADEFIKELHTFERDDDMPNLMMMSLPNNHTSGTQEGFPTPRAMVADNDLALGRIIEAVSNSKFWKETAIFVIEDDPQNGLDHVDAHRTTALCISPYTKRGAVVSTNYNQNSILRTIELILGLQPMTRFDLIASSMEDCFTDQPDFSSYKALKNNIPLDEMNPALSSISGKQLYWAKKSMNLELSYNDDLDLEEEDVLNKILWHSVKGYDVPYPKRIKK